MNLSSQHVWIVEENALDFGQRGSNDCGLGADGSDGHLGILEFASQIIQGFGCQKTCRGDASNTCCD